MNKSELVEQVALECGLSKHSLHEVLDCLLKTIIAALSSDGIVKLKGFGTFSPPQRAAREIRNLHTGEIIRIPARMAIKFKPGVKLTNAVQ